MVSFTQQVSMLNSDFFPEWSFMLLMKCDCSSWKVRDVVLLEEPQVFDVHSFAQLTSFPQLANTNEKKKKKYSIYKTTFVSIQ